MTLFEIRAFRKRVGILARFQKTGGNFIAFHKNILTLDNGGKIEIGDDENAKYRSTRVDGKGI